MIGGGEGVSLCGLSCSPRWEGAWVGNLQPLPCNHHVQPDKYHKQACWFHTFASSFVHPLRPLYLCPALCAPKTPPPPVRVLRTPRPPLRAKSPRMPPFAAYRHSTPAAFTVTRVNKVDLPFFEEAGPFPSIVPSCLQHAHSVYN